MPRSRRGEPAEEALSRGADHVLIPQPFFGDLPGEVAARLKLLETEEPGRRGHPIQLWKVASENP